jgi:hypothetical protein
VSVKIVYASEESMCAKTFIFSSLGTAYNFDVFACSVHDGFQRDLTLSYRPGILLALGCSIIHCAGIVGFG